mgnify:CR=1 FL=1
MAEQHEIQNNGDGQHSASVTRTWVKIRTEATILELGTIEAATEKAIEGEQEDRAMTIVIGLAAL